MTTASAVFLGTAVLGLLAWGALRWAGAGAGVVVVRRGRVSRVAERGLVVRAPVLDEALTWPTGPVDMPITATERTRDGAQVRVIAEIAMLVPGPLPGAPYVDPLLVAEQAAEAALACAVRSRDRATLLADPRSLGADLPGRLGSVEIETAVERHARGPR